MSREKSQVKRQSSRPFDNPDPCRPALCALGGTPHAHCLCGLPMAVGARLCDTCIAEDFRPRRLKAADHLEEWNGWSYPALRRNRPAAVPPERHENYARLLQFVLGPARGVRPATAGEAA